MATPEQCQRLNKLVDLMQGNIRDSKISDFYKNDKAFHLFIAEITKNRIFIEIAEILWRRRISVPYLNLDNRNADHSKLAEFNRDHALIAQAISEGRPEDARRHAAQHLEQVAEELIPEAAK